MTAETLVLTLEINYSSEKFESSLAYTLSKSNQVIQALNQGEPYASQYDRRHQIKSSNHFNFNNWNLYFNYTYASGRPFLDLNTQQLLNSERQDISFDNHLIRLKDYSRFDLGFEYQKKIGRQASMALGASIFNLFNRSNEAYRQNIFSIRGENEDDIIYGNSIQMLGATPTIYLKFNY